MIAARRRLLGSAAACTLALTLGACGEEERSQSADEPRGRFAVRVVEASFPESHKLAERAEMVIKVKNEDPETIPNIAVTVRSFDRRRRNKDLADPRRPVFVVNTIPGGGVDSGAETAYVDTYAFGPLKPGRTATFRWNVTAVEPGPFALRYEVAAGLDGRAKAVLAGGGGAPRGRFAGTIDSAPPTASVGDDGETILREGQADGPRVPSGPPELRERLTPPPAR